MLMEREEGPCVSMFMPTDRTDAEKNRIRFQNLLREAEGVVAEIEPDHPYGKEGMEPARGLLEQRSFWQHQSDGLDYLISIYKGANSYPYLWKEWIKGNPEERGAEELYAEAWAIMGPHLKKVREDAADKYRQHAGTGKTSKDLREIVPSAYYGRVEVLFVAKNVQQWGSFDPQSNEVKLHKSQEPGDGDLLDFAAAQSLMKGGRVYAVEPEQVPANALAAALFRY